MHGLQGDVLPSEGERLAQDKDLVSESSHAGMTRHSWPLSSGGSVAGIPHHWLLDSMWFKGGVMACVALNTIQMGIEADYPDETDVWVVCENFFTATFAVEMLLKLFILQGAYFRDKANWLDAFVTIAAMLDTWIFALLGEEGLDFQSLSILRVFRLIRLLRVLKLAKQSRKVVLVLEGLFAALQVTFFVSCLLALSIYACSIFCVEMIGRQTVYPGYTEVAVEINEQEVMTEFNPFLSFGSMGKAMLTLFSIAIFAEWTEVVRPVYLKQPGLVIFFVFFALIVCFGVMNVIIGMIVESVMSYSHRMAMQDTYKKKDLLLLKIAKIHHMIEAQHLNNYMTLKADEVDAIFGDSVMREIMQEIELPLGFSGKQMLAMLDDDGDGSLHNDKFMGNFGRLLHSGPFQQACMFQAGINEVKYLIRQTAANTEKRLSTIEAALASQPRNSKQEPPSKAVPSPEVQSRPAQPAQATARELQELELPGMVPPVREEARGPATQVQVLPQDVVDRLCSCVAEAVQRSLQSQLRGLERFHFPPAQGTSGVQKSELSSSRPSPLRQDEAFVKHIDPHRDLEEWLANQPLTDDEALPPTALDARAGERWQRSGGSVWLEWAAGKWPAARSSAQRKLWREGAVGPSSRKWLTLC